MVCYKDNIASRKSIINNGGVLENEISAEDGKIDQRYWISLKKRYADRYVNKRVKKSQQKIISVNEEYFTGEIILLDEDELKETLNRMEITDLEYENVYKEAEQLIDRLNVKKDNLQINI